LTGVDARYFTSLVHYNQAKSSAQKQNYLEEMNRLRRKVKQKKIPLDQFEYYTKWYHSVIRELACIIHWNGDYGYLASHCNPPIRKSEARESIQLLLGLGLLDRDGRGRYIQRDPAINASSEVLALGARRLNKQMITFASEAIEKYSPAQRNIQGVTLGISRESYELIEEEINEFLSRVIRIVDDDKNPEKVYQLNTQLYPLSYAPEEKKRK